MKLGMLFVIFVFVAMIAGPSFGAVNCKNLKAVSIISNEGIASGGQVIFKNVGTEATCGGEMAVNATKVFPLPVGNSDKAMAIILTGISLSKNFVVWADFSPNTLVSVSLEN